MLKYDIVLMNKHCECSDDYQVIWW